MSPLRTARRPTQIDVARLARVSKRVASYVHGAASPVAPETLGRVVAAIVELDQRPDRAARSLRRRRTSSLAGIIPEIAVTPRALDRRERRRCDRVNRGR